MNGVLVMAEHRRGALRDVTFELIGAARELKAAGAGPLAVAVLGRDAGPLIKLVAVEGVDEVVQVPLPDVEFSGDAYRSALATLITKRKPAVTLLGFTVDGMSYGPAVAASLSLGFASDVVACSYEAGQVTARREFYGAKLQAELEFPGHDQVLLMLRPTVWARAEGNGSPSITTHDPGIEASQVRTRHRDFIVPATEGVDITDAEFILSIGRGIGDKDSVPRFEKLAERLGATLACSRPLVDSGWLPSARQVGQSGKTVKPKLYVAMGISGAVQHLAGMKASATIIAINSDPEAAIFNVAHYGVIADLFEVAKELEASLG